MKANLVIFSSFKKEDEVGQPHNAQVCRAPRTEVANKSRQENLHQHATGKFIKNIDAHDLCALNSIINSLKEFAGCNNLRKNKLNTNENVLIY